MDGGRRLDQPLMSGLSGVDEAGKPHNKPAYSRVRIGPFRARHRFQLRWVAAYRQLLARWTSKITRLPLPRDAGIVGSALLIAATLWYGIVEGQHTADVISWFKDTRDTLANSLGFRIGAISLTGSKQVSREEILTTAGVTGRASLLFLDVDAARARLLANPWIADAAILKLYPDRLQLRVTERQAFALWQKDGRVSVIAADGTVLEPFVEGRYLGLPLVVGRGAQRQAKEFLAVIDRYPAIRSMLRASILVAERRWNMRLANSIDVRLPETDVERALDRLVELDRDKKLLTRDVTVVDLRLPDRVTVRLSDAAAQARDEAEAALKDKKKKKGGDA